MNVEVGIASYNLWRGNTPARVGDDLDYLMTRPFLDLICLQEGANFYGHISDLVRSQPDWAMIRVPSGSPRAQKQNIVLYRPQNLIYDTHRFIDLREANANLPDRGILRARFEVRNCNRDLIVFATHMHSHVENRAWWSLPRFQDYRRHMARMRRLVDGAIDTRVCIAVADWNVNLQSKAASAMPFFPKRSFRRVGMMSNWDRLGFSPDPTHGRRYIDAVFGEVEGIRFTWHRTVRMSSDHRALLVKAVVKDA